MSNVHIWPKKPKHQLSIERAIDIFKRIVAHEDATVDTELPDALYLKIVEWLEGEGVPHEPLEEDALPVHPEACTFCKHIDERHEKSRIGSHPNAVTYGMCQDCSCTKFQLRRGEDCADGSLRVDDERDLSADEQELLRALHLRER